MPEVNYSLIFSVLLCYLFGSIPNGYLLVKYSCQKDITKEGSGNVGTLNALKVSNSKKTGIIVLVFDFLKGMLPLLLMIYVLKVNLLIVLISSLFIIIGHNYPVWLNFRGGRGLASAAGIFAVLNYGFLITWCLIWGIYFLFRKDILMSNVIATLSLPFFAVVLRRFYQLTINSFLSPEYYNLIVFFTIIISILIIAKHRLVLTKLFPFTARNL